MGDPAEGRVEADERLPPAPREDLAGQFVGGPVLALTGEAQGGEVEAEQPLVGGDGIEVHDDEDGVGAVGRRLGVHEQVLVVGRAVEAQRSQLLQRGVPAAGGVEGGDQVADVGLGGAPVAPLQLVLLGVEVLLVGLAGGLVLAQLVTRVEAPVGAHRRREHGADAEGGRRPVAQGAGEDVGRVRPEVRSEVVDALALGELLAVLAQLPCGRAPGEVRVALGEAEGGEGVHHLGAGEGLGQEDHLGVAASGCRRSPTPRRRTASCAGCRRGRP